MSTLVVQDELPGYIQVLSDGSIKRFVPESIPATPSPPPGSTFKSKDVKICPVTPITARIFLPATSDDEDTPRLLPLLVYFHGGGFCVGSTKCSGYHRFLGALYTAIPCAVVSVDYRLAPEHRLPAAYLDCRAALDWARAKSDTWLTVADPTRVFLAGDSAGANIAHNVALSAGGGISGVALIHPFFGSEQRTKAEAIGDPAVFSNDMFWRLSLPLGSDRDHPSCNFEKEDEDTWHNFPAATIFVAGEDFLRERGEMYARFTTDKGVKNVRLIVAEKECHVFHVFYPESDASVLLRRQLSDFINGSLV